MKKILVSLLLSASLSATAAVVEVKDGNLRFVDRTLCGDITIEFKRCMANELYTFSSVCLNGKELNHTESDNIGPFGVDRRGWSGGNHLNDGRRSAYTESVKIFLDGKPLDNDTIAHGDVVTIEVHNRLLDPVNDGPFANEKVVYSVSGNSISVNVDHVFTTENPVTIERYYGMQSMFVDEMEILTPGGNYANWTGFIRANTGQEMEFTKSEAPQFCTFIEHSANGYQAAYMTSEDLGDRHYLKDDDVCFVGNSWGKNYHKVLSMHPVKKGDRLHWHGIYSWFDQPVADYCRNNAACPTFDYIAYIDGQAYVFHLSPDGSMTQTPL